MGNPQMLGDQRNLRMAAAIRTSNQGTMERTGMHKRDVLARRNTIEWTGRQWQMGLKEDFKMLDMALKVLNSTSNRGIMQVLKDTAL